MKKFIIQGTIIVLLFLAIWIGLSKINWMKVFKVQEVTDNTEQKLGELFWEVFKQNETENTNVYVQGSIDSIVNHICKANNIDRELLKIHILINDDINAFALPSGYLIIYSGLILNSDDQDELAGVICHEIAHIELNHVMKKLVKEIGLSVLISMTTGNSGIEIIKEATKMLSSSAFDRSLEREADIKAVDYLINANVNPESFANFLYKLSSNEDKLSRSLTWISTHPDSKERAEYIIEYSNNQSKDYQSILSIETWELLKEELNNN